MTFLWFLFFEDADESSRAESLQYSFGTIEVATDYFSDSNKLGQGGFGAVYKVIKTDTDRVKLSHHAPLLSSIIFKP